MAVLVVTNVLAILDFGDHALLSRELLAVIPWDGALYLTMFDRKRAGGSVSKRHGV